MITSEELKDFTITKEGIYFAVSFISFFMIGIYHELSKPVIGTYRNMSNISESSEALICPIP